MRVKRVKVPALPAPPEVSSSDQALLTSAYQTGLIVGWKRDVERGYRLTLGDRRDEYVEITKLTGFLEKLRRRTA